MRTILITLAALGNIGFLIMVGYAIKTLYLDFGPGIAFLGVACIATGFVSLGFLYDMRHPPER